jgi:hypothetical protein
MPLIPRTPLGPLRIQSRLNGTTTIRPLILEQNENIGAMHDAYDRFVHRYFSVDVRLQGLLLAHIQHHIANPVYMHLFRTMTRENAVHIMGYLRSQRDPCLYEILSQLTAGPNSI